MIFDWYLTRESRRLVLLKVRVAVSTADLLNLI
jgi:hypothetical protein